MSGLHRVQNIVIGAGGALPAGNIDANITNIPSPKLAVIGEDNQTLAAGDTVSDTSSIKLVQAKSDSSLKITQKIPGRSITSYKGETYAAGSRTVVAIGYNRKTAAGLIEVNTSTWYKFNLLFKNDKNLYSERPYRRSFQFLTGASDTQDVVAARIALAINNDAANGGPTKATAIIVGNGTTTSTVSLNGVSYTVFGGTNATVWGVEITGAILTQFNTVYKEERVYFEAFIDPTSGFGSTSTKSVINAMTYGQGTYLDIYNKENFDFGYEGVLNRVKWPIPTLTYTASSTLISTTIVPTAGITSGEDKMTFSATVAAMLAPGDQILLDADLIPYEIKYFISSTVAIVVSVAPQTDAAVVVKKKVGYDQIVIEFNQPNVSQGADIVTSGRGSVIIASPAGITGSAYTVNSVEVDDLLSVLNPYMNSLGFDSVTL